VKSGGIHVPRSFFEKAGENVSMGHSFHEAPFHVTIKNENTTKILKKDF